MWKVGSELQSTTLDPVDPLDLSGSTGSAGVCKSRDSFEAVLIIMVILFKRLTPPKLGSGERLTPLKGGQSLTRNSFFKKNIDNSSRLSNKSGWKFVVLGMNGDAVARNGPILWENEAVGSRKVFRYLWGLWEAI